MANEVNTYVATGSTVYALVRNASGQVWRPATSAFETYSASNYANYASAIALTEQGATGFFVGSFPSGITSKGSYAIDIRIQAGGSAAVSDTCVSVGTINWNGASEETMTNVPYLPSTVQSSPTPTTTQFAGGTTLSSTDNAYAGQALEFVTGTNAGQRRTISAYVGSTRLVTVESAFAIAPSSGDEFRII